MRRTYNDRATMLAISERQDAEKLRMADKVYADKVHAARRVAAAAKRTEMKDGGLWNYYYMVKYRAMGNGTSFDLTYDEFRNAIPRDRICPIRQVKMIMPGEIGSNWDHISIDRLYPDRGYTKNNIAFISMLANTMKNKCTDAEAFRRLADWMEQTTFRFVPDE